MPMTENQLLVKQALEQQLLESADEVLKCEVNEERTRHIFEEAYDNHDKALNTAVKGFGIVEVAEQRMNVAAVEYRIARSSYNAAYRRYEYALRTYIGFKNHGELDRAVREADNTPIPKLEKWDDVMLLARQVVHSNL